MTSIQNVLKSFNDECKKLNLWYSLSGLSLLELKTNGKFLSDKNIIEVMMFVEDYNKLLQNSHENIIDNLTRNDYYYTSPFYFKNNNNAIIKINLIVKADSKKTEKFYSIKNLIRQKIGYYKSNYHFSNFKSFLRIYWFKFLDIFYSYLSWHEISSYISNNTEYDGFFIVDSFKGNINKNWLGSITGKLEKVEWNQVNTFIIKEWEIFLDKKYGLEWKLNPIIEKNQINFNFIFEKYLN